MGPDLVIPTAISQRLPAQLLQGLVLRPATAMEIRARSSGEVTRPVWAIGDPEKRRAGLFDPAIFGRAYDDPEPMLVRERVDGTVDTFVSQVSTQFGHIELAVPVANPFTGAAMETIAVLPPTLRPIIYLSRGRYSASPLNDLYQRVIEVNARPQRAGELAALVEQLMLNGSAHPAKTAQGRVMTSIADHLRIAGRSGVKVLLFALGFDATWGEPAR
jgi:DNA-directed RNA polymerase beta' subunit